MLSQSGERLVRNRIEKTAIRYRPRPFGQVAELGVQHIVVMGHECCGAVDAALGVMEKNIVYPRSISQIIEPIVPAALRARAGMDVGKAHDHDAVLDAAVRENIRRVVTRLSTSERLLIELLQQKKLMIVGVRDDLDD